MKVSCFPSSETQLRKIAKAIREAGLFDTYEEQAHGENILISVMTRTFEEREIVKAIFKEAGVTEFFYGEETAA